MAKENTQEQEKEITFTKEEVDAMVKKEVANEMQKIAMAEAKEKAKKALEEETEKTRQLALGVGNTTQILNAEKKYKVIINSAPGEKSASNSLSINGVKYTFRYGEPVVLPASAISILENSVTFGKPKTVRVADGEKTVPTFTKKRVFSKEAV